MKLWLRLGLVLLGCVALGVALALLLLSTLLHASPHHAAVAGEYLLVSGLISLAVGVAGVLVARRFAPSLALQVAVAALAGSAAATINVIVTPLLMFSERSDKYLLVITLLYFLVLSLGLASIVGALTARELRRLRVAAHALAAGDFQARVPVQGADELADLARAFNQMSAELGGAFAREREMERERRDLMAAVSHDLRTPLASLRAMVEAVNDGVVSEPAEVRRYLGLAQQESEHLGRLIDDLFELASMEGGGLKLRRAPVPFGELLQETVDGLQARAVEHGVNLVLSAPAELPVVVIDGPQFQRVLVNLIDNAVHHTPAGGCVQAAARIADGLLLLTVTDTGEGITPEDQARIFERFYRGDPARGRADQRGAGLGLAIARAIVEAHGGTIGVRSRPGEGASFEVRLPLVSE